MVFALPFVDLNEIQTSIELIRGEFQGMNGTEDQAEFDWLDSFLTNYVEASWIEGSHPPESWSVANDGEEHLTNNAAEGSNLSWRELYEGRGLPFTPLIRWYLHQHSFFRR